MNLIKMIIPSVTILIMTAFTPTAFAQPQRGGLRDGNGSRPGGNQGSGAGMGGGPGGGRGGPFGGGNNDNVEFVSDICEGLPPTTCDLPPRHHGAMENDGDAVTGIFVCRTRTNPRTQEMNTFSMCIPEDRGIEGDGCGCCDPSNCPTPCDCPCDLMDRDGNPKVDQDGNPILGALIAVEGMEDDNCVPLFASAVMVERSNGAVTCAPCV